MGEQDNRDEGSETGGEPPPAKDTGDAQAPAGPAASNNRSVERIASIASTLLVVAIVGMLNYLAYRHYGRVDWTSQSLFTLSEKSEKVVAELVSDVDIYVFLSQGEPQFEETKELLKRYRDASERVRVHHVDPDREAGEFQVLAQRFNIQARATMQGVEADVAAVVTLDDKRWHIPRNDLIGWSIGPMDGKEEINVKAEQAITGAIVQVTQGRATKVCVTAGHGEWSLDEAAERPLALLTELLKYDNIEWEELKTLGKKEVPEGCDALLVLGPTRPFSDPEAQLLSSYLKGGGNLMLALNPVIERDDINSTGLEGMLLEHGVTLDRSLVLELDAERLLAPTPVQFLSADFGDHPTTRAVIGRGAVLVTMSRSLRTTGNAPHLDVLLRTSEKAFGATDISRVMKEGEEPAAGPGDLKGPLDLAYALRVGVDPDEIDETPGGRLIVIGDSELVAGPPLQAPELANADLASAWIGWLTQREALIAIPPKTVSSRNILFTQDSLMGLFLRVVLLLPGAALFMGIAIWLSRRA
ncbi:MAG: GldG family protein [Myxococcales bacterium]|nr:GldG family protein [Myxococcales bacterium]